MYQQYIPCLDPMVEQRGRKEYSLSPELYGEFLCQLFDLWYLDLQNGNQPYIRIFENYVNMLLGREAEACDMKGCCCNQYVIEADGTVYPCDFYAVDSYQIGNIIKDDLNDIQQKFLSTDFTERSFEGKEKCVSCPYFSFSVSY